MYYPPIGHFFLVLCNCRLLFTSKVSLFMIIPNEINIPCSGESTLLSTPYFREKLAAANCQKVTTLS